MMALRKDPRRRYASVQQFADDIRRYLDGRPVLAQKDTFLYRGGKFVRRNRAAVLMSTAVVIALIAATISTSFGFIRARRAELHAELQRDAAQGVVQFLQRALAAGSPYRRDGDASVLDFLEEASSRIDAELAGKLDAEASVRFTIGQTYAGLWQWAAAIPHLERAVEIHRSLGQDKTAAGADCLSTLGRALTFEHDARAVQYQWEALLTRRSLYGPEHPLVAESMCNLAHSQWAACNPPDWEQADSFFRRSLEIYEKFAPEAKADRARAAFSYASMCMDVGRYSDADRLYQSAIDIYRELIAAGPVDRYPVECLSRYAKLLMHAKRFDEAERYLKEAIELTPARLGDLGDSSPHWTLGTLYHWRGDLEEARAQYHRTLAVQCVRLAQREREHTRRLRGFARAYRAAATDRGAAPAARKVFGLFRSLKSEDESALGARMMDYGVLLRDAGETREAASLLRYALQTLYGQLWTNHWRIAECQSQLGGVLTELGEFADAEQMVLDAFFSSEAIFGRTHRRTREAAEEAFRLYEAVGEEALAGAFQNYVLPPFEDRLPWYVRQPTSPIPWRIRERPRAIGS
jgi:serine/threonine-protein kinase